MKYSLKEYAEATGMTTGNLSNYIHKLKKVILTDGMIDDSIPQNAAFLQKRQQRINSDGTSNKRKENEATKKKMISEVISERISLEDLYNELNPTTPDQPYNHDAEKKVVEIMIQAVQNDLPYIIVPVEFAYSNYSWGIIKTYEFLLNREIAIRQKLGSDINEEEINSLIKYYCELCKASISSIKEDINTIMSEIISEYETKPNTNK